MIIKVLIKGKKMLPGFYKKPWIIIAACAVITVFFGFQLPNLIIENSSRDFHPKRGESYQRFELNEEEFGSMDAIGIALETESQTILTPEYLSTVKKIVNSIETLDLVEKIDSVVNMDYVMTDEEGTLVSEKLISEDFFQESVSFVESEENINNLKSKMKEWKKFFTEHNLELPEAFEDIDNFDVVSNLSELENIQISYTQTIDEYNKVTEKLLSDEFYSKKVEFTGSAEDLQNIRRKLVEWDDMYYRVIISDDNKAAQIAVSLKGTVQKPEYFYVNDDGSEKVIKEKDFNSRNFYELETKDGKKEYFTVNKDGEKKFVSEDDYNSKKFEAGLQSRLVDEKVSNTQKDNLLQDIKKILDENLDGSDLKRTIYGGPVISDECHTYMLSDLIKLIPLVVVVVVLCLFFSFKTVDGTLLPLLTVLISTVWSMGAMALFQVPFTIVSSIIPVALIAVGSAYGIHVLTHYYIELERNDQPMTKELHANLIWRGIKDVFVAVLLAGITTMVGFISLITSPIDPLHGFAVFTSTGVFISLLLSVTLIPAMLLVKPLNKIGNKSKRIEKVLNKAKAKAAGKFEKVVKRHGDDDPEMSTYYKFFKFFTGTRPRLIIFMIVIALFSAIGIKNLVIDTATINYFPSDAQLRKDVDYVNERFAGTNSVYLVVSVEETEEEKQAALEAQTVSETAPAEENTESFDEFDDFADFDDFSFDSDSAEDSVPALKKRSMTDPEILVAIDKLQDELTAKFPEVGTVVSFTTILKRINQVMHAGPDFIIGNIDKNPDVGEIIAILNEIYVNAGGANASIEDLITHLEKKYNYNGQDYDEVPYDLGKYNASEKQELAELISQYIMLLGGDTLDRFALPKGSFEPTKLRIQIQLRENSSHEVGKIINYMKDYIEGTETTPAHFPKGYKVEFTGNGEMDYAMTNMIVSSQFTSLIISLISVFIIIAISFRSGWAGIIGALPLALTILLNYMIMGFSGIRLDLVTSIIASVAIGVGIDYTIHFMETFRAERQLSDDMDGVLKRTFLKSGRGIMTNALAVGLGFLVLCFSEFVVLRYIGILVAIVMFTSSALALTIIPGILNLHDPKFMRPKNKNKSEDKKSSEE